MKPNIIIDIYSDVVCPWCYIGLNKIKQVTNEYLKKTKFELIWRPFQLNPDIALEGIERNKYLSNKFGGSKNSKKVYDKIYKEGLNNNIYFQFEKIKLTPNSFASLKLMALAHKYNKQTQVVETLFYDYFIEGVNIGDTKELIRIAKQHQIYNKNTLSYINSTEDNVSLLAEEKQARELGIKGVPCFIINKEFVLFGAQDANSFRKIFNSILNE